MQTFYLNGIQYCTNHITGEVMTVAALNVILMAQGS